MNNGKPQSLASSQCLSVLVLELVSTGYFGDDIGDTFRREGRAMLDGVMDDFARISGVSIEVPRAVACRDETLLQSIAKSRADFSLIIAPEFSSLLETFCDAAMQSGATSLNCEPAALKLGADKWAFAGHLARQGLPHIPTQLLPLDKSLPEFPCVIKPRYGAGSWLVRRISEAGECATAMDAYREAGLTECLVQPATVGQSCSVAALVRPCDPPLILPIAEQNLSTDGEYRYLGGCIPAELPTCIAERIQSQMRHLISSIPGLNGYIGCDIIVSKDGEPVIVELNPRLTTSYIGYRRLCDDNLMERLLFPQRATEPLRWKPGFVTFDAGGSPADAIGGLCSLLTLDA